VEGESHELVPDDLTILRRAAGDLVVHEDGGYFAAIDPALTDELRLEGRARELISRVQRMRKEAGFAVSDRILLAVGGAEDTRRAVDVHGAWIAAEVLAVEVVLVDDRSKEYHDMQAVDLDGAAARVAISRVP
jgi:isoleucyl-tRNA synthetase